MQSGAVGNSLVVIIHDVLLCTAARPAPRLVSSARAPLKCRRPRDEVGPDNW